MSMLQFDDTDLYYDVEGDGDETIVFSHGLLFDGRQYDAQREALSEDYRCVAYDHRGHGASRPASGPMVDMETLYFDAVRLIEELDAAPCHFVGLSMGGFVGIRLAARRPDLLRSVVLADTRAGREPRDHLPDYRRLNAIARWLSVRLVVDRVLPLMFGDRFLDDPARRDERETWRERVASNDSSVFRVVRGVLHRPSVASELAHIDLPTLVLHGEDDRAIDVEEGRRLADAIDGAAFESFPRVGHLSSIEAPRRFTECVRQFVGDVRRV